MHDLALCLQERVHLQNRDRNHYANCGFTECHQLDDHSEPHFLIQESRQLLVKGEKKHASIRGGGIEQVVNHISVSLGAQLLKLGVETAFQLGLL